MGLIISVLQFVFGAFMIVLLFLFLFSLLLSWTWAQAQKKHPSFTEILSVTATEWGSQVILIWGHLFPPKVFHHAPPLSRGVRSKKQIPVILVPSLHTGAGIFFTLIWRLKNHHFTSLWPFTWKSFLRSQTLFEDALADYIQDVLKKTQSNRFQIISFGTSRPLVANVISQPRFAKSCIKWIAISAPAATSRTMKFLSTAKLRSAYTEAENIEKIPEILIHGTHDTFCFPNSLWTAEEKVAISPIGHYGTVLHSKTVQAVLEGLN
jgi:hypothetical protein